MAFSVCRPRPRLIVYRVSVARLPLNLSDPLVQWLERWPVTPEVTGSSPVGVANHSNVGVEVLCFVLGCRQIAMHNEMVAVDSYELGVWYY